MNKFNQLIRKRDRLNFSCENECNECLHRLCVAACATAKASAAHGRRSKAGRQGCIRSEFLN
jgi:hypothetical protein